jgi:hypothetical protein
MCEKQLPNKEGLTHESTPTSDKVKNTMPNAACEMHHNLAPHRYKCGERNTVHADMPMSPHPSQRVRSMICI